MSLHLRLLYLSLTFLVLFAVQWWYFPFYIVVVSAQGSLFFVLRL